MDITLNGRSYPSKFITFNHVPTLVHIDSKMTKGKRNVIVVYVSSVNTTWKAEDFSTRLYGYSINYTNDEAKAVNNTAWYTYSQGLGYYRGMAYHFVKALENTPLANEYEFEMDFDPYTHNSKQCIRVFIRPKKWGLNIPPTSISLPQGWMSEVIQEATDGYVGTDWNDDELSNSKVVLDVCIESDEEHQTTIGSTGKTISPTVQLVKTYYKDGITFDIAPLLSNYTENGKLCEYNLRATYIKDGQMNLIGDIKHNYCSNGYSVNQGLLFLDMGYPNYLLAQNTTRGEYIDEQDNNSLLYYIDGEEMTISIYSKNLSPFTYDIVYLDSAKNILSSVTETFTPTKTLDTIHFTPDYNGAYYIDFVLPSIGNIRYNNVKPMRYGNKKDFQTLYWFNGYGGISFFPFTASRAEERKVDRATYKKNPFDLYDDLNHREMDKVYSNDMKYTVTLKSHYIPKEGLYIIYDLMNTYEAYTYIGGIKYNIIIEDLDIEEINGNGIYQVTLKYTYSSNDKF